MRHLRAIQWLLQASVWRGFSQWQHKNNLLIQHLCDHKVNKLHVFEVKEVIISSKNFSGKILWPHGSDSSAWPLRSTCYLNLGWQCFILILLSHLLTFIFWRFLFLIPSGSIFPVWSRGLKWNALLFVSGNAGKSGTNRPGCCLDQTQKWTSKFSMVMHWLIALWALIISSPSGFSNSWQSQDSAALVLRQSQIPLACKQTILPNHMHSEENSFSDLRQHCPSPHTCQWST